MPLWKVGPVLSVVALTVALCLLALAPLGWRLGWWPYGFGLYQLFPASGMVAAVAVSLSLLTLALGRSKLHPRALVVLLLTIVVGAVLVYQPLQYAYVRRTLPPINDITTDTDNRPPFKAVLTARAAERSDRADVPDPNVSELQKAGYPDIAPVRVALPVSEAFGAALAVAGSMPGWTIVAADPDSGRIEGSQQSRWFGFTDDIVIRIAADTGGSRIDMRSASRRGTRDYGVNAARIRAYMGALRKRLG
jgi:uncharacterized protein (DUF1499 family)